MVNKSELRIGNYLLGEHGKIQPVEYIGETIGLINEVGGTDKHQKNPIFSYDIEKLKYVILDAKVLTKCGFDIYDDLDNDYTTYGNNGDDSDFFLQIDWRRKENGYCPLIKSVEYEQIGIDIKYLHQLQNLYFCLTNEELQCAI